MHDVIFNYNHSGHVLARTRNGTLTLEVRSDGLYIRARLDGTEEGQKVYDEIKGRYIDRMSFAFTVREESYDETEHTWTILKVKRLFDVSAVDIPAYDDTSIAARRADAARIKLEHRLDKKADAGRGTPEHRRVAEATARYRKTRARAKLTQIILKARNAKCAINAKR